MMIHNKTPPGMKTTYVEAAKGEYSVPIARSIIACNEPNRSLFQLFECMQHELNVNRFFGFVRKAQHIHLFDKCWRIIQIQCAAKNLPSFLGIADRDFVIYAYGMLLDENNKPLMG
eukprot:364682_1